MANTKILLSVVIVLLIGIAAASYEITTNTPGLWSQTSPQEQTDQDKSTDSGQTSSGTQGASTSGSGNGGYNVKISSDEAKSIVQTKYIEQQGAIAGTPKLITNDGNPYYTVPIYIDGEKQGEIWIDAQTGENIGGAGGAP